MPSGRTAAWLVLCVRAALTCYFTHSIVTSVSTSRKGEVIIYSRKLSRVRQVATLGGGLATFFLFAFISGRISDKGDWIGVHG